MKKSIEQVITENVTPKERVSVDDCEKCAFYNFADVCRRVACTNSNNVFSVFWAANRQDNCGHPVIDKDVMDYIAQESAERVFAASRAILVRQMKGKVDGR